MTISFLLHRLLYMLALYVVVHDIDEMMKFYDANPTALSLTMI